MPLYKAPLRDLRFLLNDVFDYPSHYASLSSGENATPDIVEAILAECARFSEQVLSPLYQSGDEEGCTLTDGNVKTPAGYKDAYDQYVMGGWQGLSSPEEFGGQGLPASMGLLKQEMMGQMKTRAEPRTDGSYRITGTKIFISSGEHDLTENIVHIVLARLPDAPKGTRGIKASATCTLNFDGASGYRIGTAIQGVGPAELSYQWALAYALERRSMRSVSGRKDPEQTADRLIHHADVRRMLLTQRAIAEGGRAMLYDAARLADHMVDAHANGDPEKAASYDDKLGFLTPILKGFLTELMYSGYVTMAYMWARMAAVATHKLDNGGDESEAFYQAKLATAEFYYERLLPRAQAHASSMLSPSRNLMQLAPEHMAFTG